MLEVCDEQSFDGIREHILLPVRDYEDLLRGRSSGPAFRRPQPPEEELRGPA